MKTCPKCNIPIQEHPANACLDAVFAEKVMGWRIIQIPGPNYPWTNRELWRTPDGAYIGINDWSPSTNISHAMEGVEKHRENIALRIRIDLSEVWCDLGDWKYDVCELHTYTKGISQPINNLISLAITRALILWVMEKE